MSCGICSEINVGPEHDISERHLKNTFLAKLSSIKKKYVGNRKGIIVSCSVTSTFSSVRDSTEAKIKLSVEPNEKIMFNFSIANDSKTNVLIVCAQIFSSKLNFTINNHGLEVGCAAQTIGPKQKFPKNISVTFEASLIGQYEMPILFCFRKSSDEDIVILREMVVYVENIQTLHEKIISPYAKRAVEAETLFKCAMGGRSGDGSFRIPKNYKPVYASALRVNDNTPQELKEIVSDIREIFTAGVTKENYIRFFHNLLWYEETIIRINLKKYNMSGVIISPRGKIFSLAVPGLAEKRPSLMIGDLIFVKPHNNDEVMFEAIISEIEENVICIRGMDDRFQTYYNESARFDIRFFMSRMPLERMHLAVDTINKQDQETRTFPVMNKRVVQIKPIINFYNIDVERNAEQRMAVEHIVAGTCGTAPYLLHGPPGTGKTVTIVESILQLVNKGAANRILVCTDSNMAADHVATQIIKYLPLFPNEKMLIRANSKFRTWNTLPQCLAKYSNGTDRNNFQSLSIKDFMSYNIVITTLSHSAKFAQQLHKLDRPITHLFIDEAAQASEPSCLIPVCGLLKPNGILVLAGDPKQLGPVVISHDAKKTGLGLSLMERLKRDCPLYSDETSDPNYIVMLRNNFRSNPDILEIPNELFYNNQLRIRADIDHISEVDILGEKKKCRAIVFHGILSKEQKMGKSPSFYNSKELEIVQKYIKALILKHEVSQEDIGVVTPYIRQVYHIKMWLKSNGYEKIEVGTVEAFQGKEKRIIIISTVRANCGLLDHDAKFQLGFLVDEKRFNVALTRAKAKAIVIGNPLCLQKDSKWRAYMQKCRELGTFVGFDSESFVSQDVMKDIDSIITMLKNLQIENGPAA